MSNPKIQVLMSTYNGIQYIPMQLDSILGQQTVDVHCLIRDDGSTDGTLELLGHYITANSNITLMKSNGNVGFAKSFYALVEQSGDYSYFAFADQDDVWLPDKLAAAIRCIDGESDVPEMCFCNSEVVDEQLNHLSILFDGLQLPQEKFERLLENRAAGCTIVFNRKARDMFLKGNPNKLQYHDFWMYVLCSYFGKVVYDPQAHIQYRQHQLNQVGCQPSFRKLWSQRMKQLLKSDSHMREYLAQELLRNFADLLQDDDKKKLQVIAQYRKSVWHFLKLLFYNKVRMSSRKKQFWFRIHTLVRNV